MDMENTYGELMEKIGERITTRKLIALLMEGWRRGMCESFFVKKAKNLGGGKYEYVFHEDSVEIKEGEDVVYKVKKEELDNRMLERVLGK
jgi:hypothetical protein